MLRAVIQMALPPDRITPSCAGESSLATRVSCGGAECTTRPGPRASEDSVSPRQAWSANGPLEDQELMTKCEVLKRDGGGTGQEGAQEGPETDRENHRGSRHEA